MLIQTPETPATVTAAEDSAAAAAAYYVHSTDHWNMTFSSPASRHREQAAPTKTASRRIKWLGDVRPRRWRMSVYVRDNGATPHNARFTAESSVSSKDVYMGTPSVDAAGPEQPLSDVASPESYTTVTRKASLVHNFPTDREPLRTPSWDDRARRRNGPEYVRLTGER